MMMLRYLRRLFGEIFEFAWQNKAWWIIPIVLVLFAVAALLTVGGAGAQFIYTLF